jgi:hypothetical protein
VGIDRYIKMSELEDGLQAIVEKMLKPAMQRVVEDSSTPYDDAGLAIAMPILDAALDKLDGEEGK